MEQFLLYLVVRCQHGQVQHDSPDDGGSSSSPQSKSALFPCNPSKGVKNILVVSPLVDWKLVIGLHSHKGEIRWVTEERADETSKCGTICFLEKGQVFLSFSLVLLIDFFSDGLVDTHPGSSVKDLPSQCRIQPPIETFDAVF